MARRGEAGVREPDDLPTAISRVALAAFQNKTKWEWEKAIYDHGLG